MLNPRFIPFLWAIYFKACDEEACEDVLYPVVNVNLFLEHVSVTYNMYKLLDPLCQVWGGPFCPKYPAEIIVEAEHFQNPRLGGHDDETVLDTIVGGLMLLPRIAS